MILICFDLYLSFGTELRNGSYAAHRRPIWLINEGPEKILVGIVAVTYGRPNVGLGCVSLVIKIFKYDVKVELLALSKIVSYQSANLKIDIKIG